MTLTKRILPWNSALTLLMLVYLTAYYGLAKSKQGNLDMGAMGSYA